MSWLFANHLLSANLRANHDVYATGCADRGSNEAYAKRAITCIAASIPRFFYVPTDCGEHSGHLCVLSGLKLADILLASFGAKWRYFQHRHCVPRITRLVSKTFTKSMRITLVLSKPTRS